MLKWVTLAPAWTAAAAVAVAEPTQLTVVGETALNGIFDPSLEAAPDAEEGWLAYSTVFGNLTPFGPHVEGWLARTTDSGVSFIQHSRVNASWFATLTMPDQSTLEGVPRRLQLDRIPFRARSVGTVESRDCVVVVGHPAAGALRQRSGVGQ